MRDGFVMVVSEESTGGIETSVVVVEISTGDISTTLEYISPRDIQLLDT